MIELIPAIDIIDGKCVRLSQGDYDKVKETVPQQYHLDFKEGYAIIKKGKKIFHKLEL